MFKKSRKDQFVEQAQGVAQDLSDAIAPKVAEARDAIAPKVADARDAIAPKVAEARDAVAPRVAGVRDQVSSQVAQAVSDAREQAAVIAAEAERRGSLASAALKGEAVQEPKSRSKFKSLLVIVGLAGIGAVVARKLAGGNADNWQSSYTPAPAPAPAAPQPGASPGETVADSVNEPHPVTTPDNPVETVEVDGDKKP
jgi:hypothetical protein